MLDKKLLELIHSGNIYDPNIKEIMEYQEICKAKVDKFNQEKNVEKRIALLPSIFNKIGNDCYIEPPLRANFGGYNVSIGNNFYSNFNLTLVDDGIIEIGNYVMIGPNVTIATACHPISPTLRKYGMQYNKKVVIEDSVWIGAGAIIMPGVTIGKNSIIGAGSIVNKSIPSNVVAVGNPCKVIRNINEDDYKYYDHDKRIPQEILEKYK